MKFDFLLSEKHELSFFLEATADWLSNLNHECSLSRPTHTWACHEFQQKHNAGGGKST